MSFPGSHTVPEPAVAPLSFGLSDIEQSISARFDTVARALPDHIAMTGMGQRWSYRQANDRVNGIAQVIRTRTRAGTGCVAHLFELSPEMVVASLAVLKAGKTCLPVHPGTPAPAQQAILRDAMPELLLTNRALEAAAREIAAGTCEVVTLDDVADAGSPVDSGLHAEPSEAAFIVYTSGSTGHPKGVVWSHRRTLHRVWLSAMYDVSPADRQSLLRHCSLNAAQTDMLVALLQGSTLCLFDVVAQGLPAFTSWIDEEHVTILRMPTLLLRRFLGSLDPEQVFRSVRIVSVGGDTALPSDLELWKRHFAPPCTLCVRFSTTETAELTTSRFDHDTELGPEGANFGHAVPDKDLSVVDDSGQPVQPGVEGDLIVTSAYLADGYWKRPDETARAFTRDPRDPNRVSYRTGDRGRLLPDGRFVFSGRGDQQVKIRGYRVDIQEVESALRHLDGVSDATVVAVKQNDDQRLLALVVPSPGEDFIAVKLRARMLERLPEWKVPSRFFEIGALPTTLSGKADRQRLNDIAIRLDAEQMAVVPGDDCLDPLEQQIAEEWRALLRCDRVTATDDFFLLGGDSLQATVLHLKIERLTGTLIPVETLFKQPTVRGMAEVVRGAEQVAPRQNVNLPPVLVPFRSTGTLEPLFLVHGRPGWSFARPEFLEILGEDQPVYGFQASGLDRSRMRANTVPEMAREYVRAMKQLQPRGPYFIGSACIGFLVAIEMANQLRAAGDRVGPLLLIDPTPPAKIDALYLSRWRRYRKLARLSMKKLLTWTTWHDRKRAKLAEKWGHEIRKDPLGYEAGLRARVDANLEFAIARLKYTQWQYDGPILILQSTKRRQNALASSAQGVFGGRFTGEVQWFEAGDTHHDVIRVQSALAARQIRQGIQTAHEALARLRSDVHGPAEARPSRS